MLDKYIYIYGPVSSWRLGSSLGIDPLSGKEKICTFDCVYCQLGKTGIFSDKREIFVPTERILEEVKSLPPLKIDYITFSGRGEATLAGNLGDMIKGIRRIRKEKIAVITNSSLMDREDVRKDLVLADFVMAKLDANSEQPFLKINKPMQGIAFDKVLKSIKEFRSDYKGKFALQIMFLEENKKYAGEIAALAKEIKADEIQLNTPLRPCASKPLSKEDMDAVKGYFKNMNIISVYDAKKKKVESISKDDTLRRRGKS